MNTDYTHLAIVQDKSGSMTSLRDETIQGFNTYLEEQQKLPGKCTFSLLQFDTDFNVICEMEPVKSVRPLTRDTYRTIGNTALLDAIGRTIVTLGQKLEALPEAERPARVIIAVITDGEENSSEEYQGEAGRAKIFEMIKHQTETYKWQFVFLGANQDAIKSGQNIGMAATNSISMAHNSVGVKSGYVALAANTTCFRSSSPDNVDAMMFSKEQREEQYAAGAVQDAMATPDSEDEAKK